MKKSLYDLHQNFIAADKRYDKRLEKLRKEISDLEAKKDRMRYPHFIEYLKKLGKQILPKIKGAVSFEVAGPFGLGNECSLWFYGPGTEKTRKVICGASFRRYGDGYGLKDYSKKSNRFPKGSIGEMNGMNYRTIEISKDMNIDWFIKFMRKK